MKAKLTEAVRLLANGTANDKDSSPIMRGVLITERQAVCADGYIVVIKQLPSPEMNLDGPPIDDGIKTVVVPSDAIKACKGDDVALSCVEVMKASLNQLDAIVGDKTKIVARLDGADFSVEADAIQGEFPKYEKLFTPSPLIAQIAFSPRIMKKLLRTLPDDGVVRLRISAPDKAVELQCTDPDGDIPIRGLIMPMAVSDLNVTWNTPDQPVSGAEKVVEAVADKLAEHANEPPKEGENTITLTAGGKSVTMGDKQFSDAVKKITNRCPTCGGFTNAQGFCKKCGK